MKQKRLNGYQSMVGLGVDMFSQIDLEQIHLATLEVLANTGVRVDGEKPLKALADAGCIIEDGTDGKIVKIPQFLVEECIRTAPSTLFLAGREEKYDIPLMKGRTYFTPVKQPCYVFDIETGEYRLSTLQDVADTARLVDALDAYDMNDALVSACDVPPEVMDLHIFKATAANTSKFTMTFPALPVDKLEYFLEMASAVAGSEKALQARPFIIIGSAPISPLFWKKEAAECMMFTAEHNLPALAGSMVMAGGTGPTTLAGALVVHNAEELSGLVISQIARAGAPFIYASSLGMMYLKKAVACVGSPECALLNTASTKLAQLYDLPNIAGGT